MHLFNTGYNEKTKITDSKTITEKGKYALDAYQNNPTKPNTLAYDLLRKLDIVDGAAAHNGIFRGKNITDLYNSGELWTDIADGSFRNEYIGDYFDITISTEYTANETVRCIIAGLDMYYLYGDTPLTKHHAVIVLKNCFAKTHQMNPTNTTNGGYFNASIWTVLDKYADAILAVIGLSHFIKYRKLVTNAISETSASMAGGGLIGCSSSWDWHDAWLSLLSEIQVYGSNVCSSSFYDTGIDNLQLPLFALDPTAKVCKCGGTDDVNASNGQWWWLKNVASTRQFASASGNGDSGYRDASNGYGGVRPLFLIG